MAAITGTRQEPVDRAAIDAEHERLNGAPRDEQPPVEELRVDGTAQLGLFKAGGKAPTGATLRLAGGAIDLVDGKAFEKGDVIAFSGTAIVREVGQRDKEDRQTGIVVSCTQKHIATIVDLTIET